MESSRHRLLLLLHSSLLLFLLTSPSSFSIIPSSSSSSSPSSSTSSSSLLLSVEALTIYVAGEGRFYVSDHEPTNITPYAAKYQTETGLWTSLDKVQGGLNGGAFIVRSPGDDQAYFGGRFQTAGGKARSAFAKFDGTKGVWDEVNGGTANPKGGATVNAIFTNPCNNSLVFIGGGFRQVSDEGVYNAAKKTVDLQDPINADRVAVWNVDSQTFSPLGDGLNGVVFSLFVQDDILYATGTFRASFDESNPLSTPTTLNGIAYYDLISPNGWQQLNGGGFRPQIIEKSIFSTSFGTAIDGILNPKTSEEAYIYVMGNFAKVGSGVGVVVNGIARYHTPTGTWSSLGDSTTDGPTNISILKALTVVGGQKAGGPVRVYIGGVFGCRISDSNIIVPNLCVWKEETNKWYPVGQSFNGTSGIVTDLKAAYDPQVDSDVLYAVGEWISIDKRKIPKIAYWAQATNKWSALGDGGSDYRISSIALSLPCHPIPLTVSPTPLPSETVFCHGQTCDDIDPCTIDFCTEQGCIHTPKTCSDGDLCTNDLCSATTGECLFEPIAGCGEVLKSCQQLVDCGECIAAGASGSEEGCSWLQCAPENSVSKALSNFTTFALSNTSGSSEFAIFTTHNITLVLEDPVTGEKTSIPHFALGSVRAFFATNDDLRRTSAFGATRVTTGQCVPSLLKEKVLENNTPFGLTCDFVDEGQEDMCGVLFEADQLSAKAKTIGTSVGVTAATAGGGCGGFAVVLLFYRRKKAKDIREAKVAGVSRAPTSQNFAAESPVFEEHAGKNQLYTEDV